MDEKKQELMENQKLLHDEYLRYKDKKTTYKPYIQSMDDISVWLENKGK